MRKGGAGAVVVSAEIAEFAIKGISTLLMIHGDAIFAGKMFARLVMPRGGSEMFFALPAMERDESKIKVYIF